MSGYFTATNVELALAELGNHIYATPTDAHDASAISFVPTGTIAANNVQAAIAEVAAEATGGGTPADGSITNAKLADMNTNTVKARSGTLGPPQDMTMAGFKAILAMTASSVGITDGLGFYTSTNVEGALTEIHDYVDTSVNDAYAYTTTHVNDATGVDTASAIGITDIGSHFDGSDVKSALDQAVNYTTQVLGNLNTHAATSVGLVHYASAVSYAGGTSNVDIELNKLNSHLASGTDAHDASAVSFVPTASIAATTVQAAITEVAAEAARITVDSAPGSPAVDDLWVDTTLSGDT